MSSSHFNQKVPFHGKLLQSFKIKIKLIYVNSLVKMYYILYPTRYYNYKRKREIYLSIWVIIMLYLGKKLPKILAFVETAA